MGTRARTGLGVAILLTALTAPWLMRIHDALEGSPLPELLLELKGLDAALTSDALQLRLGLAESYDSLAVRQREIEQHTSAFVSGAGHLPLPARNRLLSAFAAYQELAEHRGRALEEFSTDNATLHNSLRLLGATYDRARQHLAMSADSSAMLEELDTLHRRTLRHYASSDASSRDELLRDLERARERVGHASSAVGAMLGHARIVVEQEMRVEDNVRRIVASSGEVALSETFGVLQREALTSFQRTDVLRAALAALCLLGAVVTCGAGGLALLRQKIALEREMRQRASADDEARRLEGELRHAQKLESVGQLAAGIAHEINTPTQYVSDNTTFLQESFQQVLGALDECRGLIASEKTVEIDSRYDLEFARAEIPRALTESLDGLGRIGSIVKAMKSFSHPSTDGIGPADLNAAIQSTTTVARHEWKYVADLELDLDPALPAVPCNLGEFNQVVLNMLVNAAHAIAARLGHAGEKAAQKGRIRISTRAVDGCAEIRISDSGTGIPDDVLPRIFDPFFTTKEVGKGTGQGLGIAHGVIVVGHGGTIAVETQIGQGTTFVVRLPLLRSVELAKPAAPTLP